MLVFGFYGSSGSGKTGLIEKLVENLSGMGFGVFVIKHAAHGLDLAGGGGKAVGKDVERLFGAGAAGSVGIGGGLSMALFSGSLAEKMEKMCGGGESLGVCFLRFFLDFVDRYGLADVVFVEGFSGVPWIPKIKVGGDDSGEGFVEGTVFVHRDFDETLAFLVSQLDVHRFHASLGGQNCGGCGLRCGRLAMKIRDGVDSPDRCVIPRVRVFVDGKEVSLRTYPAMVVGETALALVKTLKGTGGERGWRRAEIVLWNRDQNNAGLEGNPETRGKGATRSLNG